MKPSRPLPRTIRSVLSTLDGADVVSRKDLIPMHQPMSREQLEQRARLIGSILETRKRIQALRDRADALSDALSEFRERQEQIRRRA